MKLQDRHPYDSFPVGIKNIYYIDYKGDFHINAPFIIAPKKTISTGCTYVLIESLYTKKCIVRKVRLQDAYYNEGTINLVLQDIISLETFIIDQKMNCMREYCKWILIDLDDVDDVLNTEVIKSYHDTCNNAESKSTSDSNPIKPNDDLLEFDF